MNRTALGALVLAVLLVAGVAVPAMALSTGTAGPSASDSQTTGATARQDGASVNVSVGPQLSTVIGASSDEVQTDVDNTAFELSVEGASDEATAEAIAERADQLRERAAAIREEYQAATAAFEAGELTRSEYAQRIAALNARASGLLSSYEQLEQRAATVSALELRAAGVSESALDRSAANLSSVTGAGPRALLERFTGESEGEIELDTGDGLSIEVESEDGERSRELERPRDGDDSLTTSQSAALETAREALSAPGGRWVLTGSQVAEDDGAYVFTFALQNAASLTGEAAVSVDGSTGELFALEEEIEPRESGDGEEDDRELAIVVAEGTPAPGATVTVQVLADGEPAEGATVSLDDRAVGTTGADGRLTVTLPAAEEAELTARSGDAEGDLEFEFDGEGTDEVLERLVVDASLDGDTVTATVSYDGDGVEGASVSANGRAVGTTGPDGTVTFAIDAGATEELELEVVKGAFEADLEYAVRDGSLRPADEEDGDEADPGDAEADDREEETDDTEADDGDEVDHEDAEEDDD